MFSLWTCTSEKFLHTFDPKSGNSVQFSSVLSLSCVWLFVTPWTAARQASLSITNSRSLLKLMSIELVMTSSHLILCHPLLLLSIFPSIRVFSNKSALLYQVAKLLELHLHHQSFQWILNWFPLGWTGWISLQSRGLSRVFSNNTFQKHQFFDGQPSLRSNSHMYTWLLKRPYLWLNRSLSTK